MSLHKLTAGDGYTYLTRQVAAADASSRGRQTLGDYYAEKGESPGRWVGAGAVTLGVAGIVAEPQMVALFGEGRHPDADRVQADLLAAGERISAALRATQLGRPFAQFAPTSAWPQRLAQALGDHNVSRGRPQRDPVSAEDRATVRTELARRMFEEQHGRAPADTRELSGFIARVSRPAHVAVAGYDLTFSPVKSVSTLWAIAPREISEVIAEAHRSAVEDAVRWLESEAAFTRVGAAGVRQVDVQGLIGAAFVHRDSRAGDPDLHTHVAISNKVQTVDGRWLALDGRVLYKANVAASERYNTRLESELGSRLGLRFAPRRGADPSKRHVREVVGVDDRLNALWSRRRQSIDARRAELTADFQHDHGRPPTAAESISLAEQANLDTRGVKHEPRSLADQRDTWRAEARTLLGRRDLASMVARAVPSQVAAVALDSGVDVDAVALRVANAVSERRATWQTWHLRAEAERQLRPLASLRPDIDALVESVVERAGGGDISIPLRAPEAVVEPAQLQRRSGESVYAVHGSQLFTSAAVLAAERRILAAARRDDGRRIDERFVTGAIEARASDGLILNTGQTTLVHALAASGARVQLALAPAGTGKTTAMKALAKAWRESGGTVVGLAPSAAAASELAASIGFRADTIDKLVWHVRRPDARTLDWIEDIDDTTLIVIDEAGMASTANLDATIGFALSRGASVRLVGDDRQLAAVAAGGVLRDIQSDIGAVTLQEVVRFTHSAEGSVSLALRQGDRSAIGFYLDHGRVHAGTPDTVMATAYDAWTTDRAHGLDSLMLAPRVEQVAVLNAQARADRLSATGTDGPSVLLADGTEVSEGDTIISRRNERRLPLGHTDFVRNGYRWTVRSVHGDGAVDAVQRGTGKTVQLPPAYVGEWVRLGYATTIHGAQGITVDTAHTVVDPTMTRDLLYVAATRGRERNEFHVPVVADGGEHEVIRPETTSPRTAAELLSTIVERDGSQVSAMTSLDEINDPRARLAAEVGKYQDAVTVAAEQAIGGEGLQRLEYGAEWIAPGVTDAPAWPTLRARLAIMELSSGDALQRLGQAKAERRIDGADDVAALLEWRLADAATTDVGPMSWLQGHGFVGDERWATYLDGVSDTVSELVDEVRTLSRTWALPGAAGRPRWVLAVPEDAPSSLVGDVAVWRAALAVEDTDLRLTGARQFGGRALAAQHALDARLDTADRRGDGGDTVRWADLGREVGQGVVDDPYWTVLAQHLSRMERAGLDVDPLVRSAAVGQLPDELPAAALWWRIAAHLSPDVAAAPMGGTGTAVTPSWEPQLVQALGAGRVAELHVDPMWPALVAASDRALRAGWDVGELYRGGQHGDAEALLWRIGATTDLEPVDLEQLPPDPAEDLAPADLHLVGLEQQPAAPQERAQPRVRALAELKQELAAARANLRQLEHDVMRDQGPNMTALRPMLLELRREADRMAPLLAERSFAQSDAFDADVQVALAKSAVRERGDPTSPDELTSALGRAETLAVEVHSYVIELEAMVSEELAGAREDPAATAETAFGAARELDAMVLGAARRDVDSLDAGVFRAGLAGPTLDLEHQQGPDSVSRAR